MVSRKNESNIMVKNAIDVVFGGLAYWIFGYGFSFGKSKYTNGFAGIGDFFTDASVDEMGFTFAKYFFQLSFATTATTIVSGSMAERTNLRAYILFSFTNTISYCFPAHWIWDENGFLFKLGCIDIAGCSAVHMVGGAASIVAASMLKPRHGRFEKKDENEISESIASPTNVVLGTFMLWWGWLGFNCGSTFGISGGKWKLASRAAVVTMQGSIGGGLFAIFDCYVIRKKTFKRRLDIPVFTAGILGGLVGITAICAICKPWAGLISGAIGAAFAIYGIKVVEMLKIDDPVGCAGVHWVAGIWGMLAVGFFVEKDDLEGFSNVEGIVQGGSGRLLGVQILVCVCVTVWSMITTFIQLYIIDKVAGLRVSLKNEMLGADYTEHGILDFVQEKNHVFGRRLHRGITEASLDIRSVSEHNPHTLQPGTNNNDCKPRIKIVSDHNFTFPESSSNHQEDDAKSSQKSEAGSKRRIKSVFFSKKLSFKSSSVNAMPDVNVE